MDILVKVSGSLIENKKFYNWLASIFTPPDNLFILCGGGDKITRVLKRNGVDYTFGPQGREIKSASGRYLAKKVLQEEKALIEKKLWRMGIRAAIIMPVTEAGERILHINGDSYAMALYPNFDKIFIVTLKGRIKSFPENLNKIKVVHL